MIGFMVLEYCTFFSQRPEMVNYKLRRSNGRSRPVFRNIITALIKDKKCKDRNNILHTLNYIDRTANQYSTIAKSPICIQTTITLFGS